VNAVVDTNVVVSAIFWQGDSRNCLVLWARRKFHLAITLPIFDEYCEIARRVARRVPGVNPEPWLDWIESKAKVYEPSPLGRRSRDPEDDPFLACALASGAKAIVSKDRDLLALKKPFGFPILTPRQFIAQFF
jgi:putative PIN family toxin of toxin-antitoxin system